MAMRNTTLSK